MRALTLALSAVLALSGPALAQFCGGVNTGNTFADNVSMGGPNLLFAQKYVVPYNMVVFRLEVFTGESTGTNTLGIWDHDPAGNRPLTNVATGSWSMSSVNSWQGTALPSPVFLPQGSTWWVVWGPRNGAQANRDTAGTTVEYRGSFDGGTSWNGPYFNLHKFRLFCTAGWPSPFSTTLTANPNGTVTLAVSGTPSNAFQGYTLISADVSQPVNSGPILGIVPDALTLQIALYLAPIAQSGNPLHWLATPGLFPDVPFVIPAPAVSALSGLTWDFVTVTLDTGILINGISTADRISF
jgi:hypothetical protein